MSALETAKASVLVVDDELAVRRFATYALSQAGLVAQVACSGAEGLDIFSRQQDAIRLVISDVIMPGGMDGLQMIGKILQLKPDVKVLFMSGYSDAVLEVQARKSFQFIRKPFLAGDLVAKVQVVLGNSTSAAQSAT